MGVANLSIQRTATFNIPASVAEQLQRTIEQLLADYLSARSAVSLIERAALTSASKVNAQLERERALRKAAQLKLSKLEPLTACVEAGEGA